MGERRFTHCFIPRINVLGIVWGASGLEVWQKNRMGILVPSRAKGSSPGWSSGDPGSQGGDLEADEGG